MRSNCWFDECIKHLNTHLFCPALENLSSVKGYEQKVIERKNANSPGDGDTQKNKNKMMEPTGGK